MSESDEKTKAQDGFFSWNNLRSLFVLLVVIFAFRWSVAAPYHVPTSSMEPSIKVGDRVLANHLAFHLRVPFTQFILSRWSEPSRGDIVVFDSVTEPGITLVKRVIGVAGDTLELKDQILYINGEAQDITLRADEQAEVLADVDDTRPKNLYREQLGNVEHWVAWDRMSLPLLRERCNICNGEFKVPENSIFVMGDNRDNSRDSRFFGVVSLDKVFGRASRILWSMYFPEGWMPNFRFYRFGRALE